MSERREGHNATRRQTMKRWKVALVAVLTIAMVMQSSNVQAIAEGIAEGLAGDRPVVTDTMPTDGTGTDAATGAEDVTTDETAEDTASTEATTPETDEAATETEVTEEESTDAPAAPEEVVEDTTETEAPAEAPAEEADTTVTLNVEISGAKLTYTAEDGTEQNVTPETDPKSVDVPNTLDFKFTVTPDEGQKVSSVSYGETVLTADETGEYTVAAADLTDGEKIVVTTEAIPAEETPAEETPAEPEAPAEEAPVEDEATPSEYSLTISHRLEVTGGYYESVETVRVSPDSLINGEYDPAQNAKSVDGLRVVSSSPVKVVDFEDDGVAETTLEYGVADSYQVDPLDEGNENSYVLLGELEDINIQAASQKFVVVRFQYESGATAAEPYSQAISANDEGKFAFEYSVNVPDGFTMRVETDGVYVEGNTISMTYTDNSDAEVVVVFVGTEAEFKVEYYFQKLEGSEYDHDSSRDETRTGLVTTLTDVQPSQIDGFTYQPVEQQIIEASGTVVKVFYNRNTYTLMYDTNGGSYVPSTSVRYGQAVSLVSGDDAPTRKGYTFDGWYLDEDLSKKADSSVVLSGDTTVYAKWDGAIVGYKVVYMTENADDNGYSYAGTVELSAKAGTTVSADNMTQKPYGFDTQHFSFERATSADVAADGSTVITVRYSRNEYTITFEGTGGRQLVCGKDAHEHSRYEGCYELDCPYGGTSIIHWWHDDNCYDYSHTICGLEEHSHTSECYGYRDTLTITAKYQAFIGDQWLDLVKGTSWYWSGKQFTSYQASMPGENKSLEKYSDRCNRNLLYYIEDPEGTVEYRGKTFTLFADVLSTGSYPTFDEEFFAIDGYDRYGSTIEKWQNGTEGYGDASWDKTGGGSFYYTRHSYDLELIGGGVSESHEVPYLGSFSDEAASFINEMGSSFDGWYLDPEFTTPYEGDFTMPKGLVLYAKTKVNTYDVTFLCEENGDQFGTAMTVEENDTVENPGIPTKEGYVFDGWYWRVDGAEQAYDFANQITGDTIIYAKWRESSTVAYTVQHKIGNEVIKETEPVTVSVGTTVQANALSNDELVKISSQYDGYLPDAYTKSIKVSAEEHTIVFNYASPSSLTYKVAYVTEAGTQVYVENEGNPVSASASEFIVTPTEEGQRWAELNGYSFIDESVVAKLSVGSENVIKITVEPTEYTITYDLGEGAWDPESDGNHPETYTVAEIESPGVSITAQPVRDGYAFAGWELGELTSVKDPAGGEFGSPKTFSLASGTVGHLKFKAKWEKLNKVTYDWGEPTFEGVREGEVPTLPTDNGSYVLNQPYTVDGKYTSETSVNSYDAYGNVNGTWTFSGWKVDGEGDVVTGEQKMDADGVTLEGTWTFAGQTVESHKVTYAYSGAVPNGAPALPTVKSYVLNEPVEIVDNPTMDGWTFSGWDPSEDFKMPSKDVTITGYWIPEGVNDFSLNGYSGVYNGESHGVSVDGALVTDVIRYLVNGEETTNSFTNVTPGTKVTVEVVRDGVTIWSDDTTVTITPAKAMIVVNNNAKVYGEADPEFQGKVVLYNDGACDQPLYVNALTRVQDTLGEIVYSRTNANAEDAGTYEGVLTAEVKEGTLNSNYTYEVWPGDFHIAKSDELVAEITTSAEDLTKVYDGKALTLTAKANPAEGSTLMYSTDGGKTWSDQVPSITNVGVLDVMVKAVNRNYEDSYPVEAALTVTKAPLTVTTGSGSKVYDGTALTNDKIEVNGFVNGENAPHYTTGTITEPGRAENTYVIDWTSADATADEGNYVISVENLGELVVTKQSIDPTDPTDPGVDPDPDDPVYDGAKVTFPDDVMYNGGSQQLPVTVVDGQGKTLTPEVDYTVSYSEDTTNVGTVHVTVTGQGKYAGVVEGDYDIYAAPLTVTTPSASKVYDGTALTAGPAEIEGVQGDDDITATAVGAQAEVGQSANTVDVDWNGLFGNYDVTYRLGTLTVFPQSIDPSDPDPDNPEPGDPDPSDPDPENPDQPFYTGVGVDSPSDVVYDGADHTWIPTVTDGDGNVLVANRDYTVSYSTSDRTNVTGTITVTITGTGNFAGTVTRTYQVVPRPLVVQANDQTKVQGAADPALSSGYNPAQLVAGEEPGWTGGLTREAGEAVGTYAITQGTLALEDNGDFLAANYVLTVLPGTLTITAAPAPDNPPATTDDGGDDTPTTPAGPTNPVPDDTLPVTDAAEDATTDDATPEETVTDDENPLASGDEEGIEDNGNPLASGRGDEDCWVHWLILVGMILTAVYFVGVAVRRRKFTADLLDYEDKVLGNNRNDA